MESFAKKSPARVSRRNAIKNRGFHENCFGTFSKCAVALESFSCKKEIACDFPSTVFFWTILFSYLISVLLY